MKNQQLDFISENRPLNMQINSSVKSFKFNQQLKKETEFCQFLPN